MARRRLVLVVLAAVAVLCSACAVPTGQSPASHVAAPRASAVPVPARPVAASATPAATATSAPSIAQLPGAAPHASKLPPVIFYSPHPDDESIGMAQAIRRAVRIGRPVYVVLLTDGEASRAYESYYRKHPELWRDYDHSGHAGDRCDFGMSRRLEFMRATTDLGVPRSHLAFYGAASRDTANGLTRDYFPVPKVMQIMRGYEKRFPGALHVTVMKYTDGNPHGAGDAMPQQEHRAACEALRRLVQLDHVHAEFYKVYVYDLPMSKRWAPHIENDVVDHFAKVNALEDGYSRVGTPGHFGIGWASVTLNIRNDLIDTHEYRTDASDFE